jgi:hypothetical protein
MERRITGLAEELILEIVWFAEAKREPAAVQRLLKD